jgi:hypothetical protein
MFIRDPRGSVSKSLPYDTSHKSAATVMYTNQFTKLQYGVNYSVPKGYESNTHICMPQLERYL